MSPTPPAPAPARAASTCRTRSASRRSSSTNDVGSILAGGTDIPVDTTGKGGPGNTGQDWAYEYNTMQAYAIQHSRLHIPVIFGVDAVHGFGHPYQAPLFPQSIGMGATWDPSAAKTGGEVTANALAATGWNWDFAPVQDLAAGQPVGPLLRDLGGRARAGGRDGRRQRERHADRARQRPSRSPPRSSTSPRTRRRSTGTTGCRPRRPSATCRTPCSRRTRPRSRPGAGR